MRKYPKRKQQHIRKHPPGTTKLHTNMEQSFYNCAQNVVDDGNPVVCTIFDSIALVTVAVDVVAAISYRTYSTALFSCWMDGCDQPMREMERKCTIFGKYWS